MVDPISLFARALNSEEVDRLKAAGYMSPLNPIFNGSGFSCRNCFLGHIRVLTRGGPRAIRELTDGSFVIGYSEGKLQETRILRTMKRIVSTSELIRLRFGYYRKNSIVSTQDHPFYESKLGWIEARNLKVGDELFYLPKGQVLSLYKRINNPMKNPELVKKVQSTLARLRSEGKIVHHGWSEEARQRVSQRMKLHNPMKNPAIAMKTWANRKTPAKPSGPESLVMSIIEENSLPIWYCGDGQKFWIGFINPDFKVHEQKKVIEVWQRRFPFNRDDSWASMRQKQWVERGYECLMLEIPRARHPNREAIAQQLQSFVSNGLPIIGIERPRYHQSEVDVYNIQTDSGNYFVKNSTYMPWVLVHNCDWYAFQGRKPSSTGALREYGTCRNPEIRSLVEFSGCCNKFTFDGVSTG